MLDRRKYIPFHTPSVFGTPIVYQKGDMVKTRDGRWGIVTDFQFQDDLILYKENKPSRGILYCDCRPWWIYITISKT